MSNEITQLEPKLLWKHFYNLTQIPRPSGHEAQAAEYVTEWGKKLGLETIVDETGNVIIRKPATPGMENKKTVCLQGHLDIVPQKNSNIKHDFVTDPLTIYIDGDWVTAQDTTLGADNGIGVAAALAVLESTDFAHGPIEALMTVDEESGMTGIFGLKPGLLKSDICINMDSEDEGELYIGCAGGIDSNVVFKYEEEPVPAGSTAFEVKISGLKGGHSGLDINLGRGNAIKIINRFLYEAAISLDLRLAGIDGGSLRNAIPREAGAKVTVSQQKEAEFKNEFETFVKILNNELSATEPDLKLELLPLDMPESVMIKEHQDAVIKSLYGCPNGAMRMSDAVEGLVETSTNLAVVKSDQGRVEICALQRSSVDSARSDLCAMIRSIFELAGGEVVHEGAYPGWKPNPDSPILKVMQDVYNTNFGKIPEIKAIHAGLECGILGAKYPNMDLISFGPTIRFPHSPDEKVNIPTVAKFWTFLVETLKNID